MKFKTSSGQPMQIILLSGHSVVIPGEFGEDPINPIFINEALARGCIADEREAAPNTVKVQAGSAAMNQVASPEAAYRAAFIDMLGRKGTAAGDNDFTADGTPNTNSVSKLVGFRANKEELLAEWHKLAAEAGADAPADPVVTPPADSPLE